MTASKEVRVCANCTRERPKGDLFWHAQDRVWYCQDIQLCEARWSIVVERNPALHAGRTRSGQTP